MHPARVDGAAVEVLQRTPGVLRALLAGLPAELLERPNAEGWSLRDIVAHLHDVEGIAFIERITRMLDEDQPFIRSIDPPARLIAGNYAARDMQQLLEELDLQRHDHAAWLASLSPDQLLRTGEHDEVGEIRVIDIAHQWAAHDMAHLRQAALMIQQYFAPMMGATRGFYDV
jgi:DinB superfamily